MKMNRLTIAVLVASVGLGLVPGLQNVAGAAVFTQCPGDTNGDAVLTNQERNSAHIPANVKCMHLTGGDGFIKMADGYPQYIFGFSDVTGTLPSQVMNKGLLAANFPAPTIVFNQEDIAYVNLTNVTMVKRPDLADGHSVHYHGFPQAASVFDGVPESSVAIREGSTFTYFYKNKEPGTYMYHCHVEAAEHMHMGMLGNLYVKPAQNNLADGTTFPNGFVHRNQTTGNPATRINYQYAYNDNDGSTRYDVEAALQLSGFDHNYHDNEVNVQPFSFADMREDYPMINGRGYPDTKNPAPLTTPVDEDGVSINNNNQSQKVSALVTVGVNKKLLLRVSNLSVTRYYTVTVLGLPMKVIANGGKQLRGPTGLDTAYNTTSLTLGGGESADVLIDTTGITPGRYFLYTTNLNYLSNRDEDFGGMMTEIVVTN